MVIHRSNAGSKLTIFDGGAAGTEKVTLQDSINTTQVITFDVPLSFSTDVYTDTVGAIDILSYTINGWEE